MSKEMKWKLTAELSAKLPQLCFAMHPVSERPVMIEKGMSGFYQTVHMTKGQAFVDELNADLGVTKAQAEAMLTGSMFGWGVPGADPDRYDEKGESKK